MRKKISIPNKKNKNKTRTKTYKAQLLELKSIQTLQYMQNLWVLCVVERKIAFVQRWRLLSWLMLYTGNVARHFYLLFTRLSFLSYSLKGNFEISSCFTQVKIFCHIIFNRTMSLDLHMKVILTTNITSRTKLITRIIRTKICCNPNLKAISRTQFGRTTTTTTHQN